MRCLNLYAGIGGLEVACPKLEVVAAIDIDQQAGQVYRSNFSSPYHHFEIGSLKASWFEEQQANFWWMSPPCLPYTVRGKQRDLNDSRAKSFLHLIDVVAELRPACCIVENVPGFEISQTFQRVQERWTSAGYQIQVQILCPSDAGWPNRRRRVYVMARHSTADFQTLPSLWTDMDDTFCTCFLDDLLEPEEAVSQFYLTQPEILAPRARPSSCPSESREQYGAYRARRIPRFGDLSLLWIKLWKIVSGSGFLFDD